MMYVLLRAHVLSSAQADYTHEVRLSTDAHGCGHPQEADEWLCADFDHAQQTEFKYLQRAIAAGTAAPQIHDLTMVDDQVSRWQFKLKGFDDDVPGALGAICHLQS